MDTKLVGDLSEAMVVVELLKLGMNVLKPIGDRLPYDVAIDCGGRLVRLQVRTCYYNKRTDSFIGNVRCIRTNRKRYLSVQSNTEDVEFFVFVVQDHNAFYILPSDVVKEYRSAVSFAPHRDTKTDLEPYKSGWQQIDTSRVGLERIPAVVS